MEGFGGFIKSQPARKASVASFLLEIGTEELPADFAAQVLAQLEPMVRRDLSEQRLACEGLSCTSTPRRIAVCIDGLAPSASDLQEERKEKDGWHFVFSEPSGVSNLTLVVGDLLRAPDEDHGANPKIIVYNPLLPHSLFFSSQHYV